MQQIVEESQKMRISENDDVMGQQDDEFFDCKDMQFDSLTDTKGLHGGTQMVTHSIGHFNSHETNKNDESEKMMDGKKVLIKSNSALTG